MTDTLISFETAQLAKEKGFQELCYAFYNEGVLILNESGIDGNNEGVLVDYEDLLENYNQSHFQILLISAPTQALLQKWLREVHKIDVYCIPFEGEWHHNIASQNPPFLGTYEDSLEQALLEGLKLIK